MYSEYITVTALIWLDTQIPYTVCRYYSKTDKIEIDQKILGLYE